VPGFDANFGGRREEEQERREGGREEACSLRLTVLPSTLPSHPPHLPAAPTFRKASLLLVSTSGGRKEGREERRWLTRCSCHFRLTTFFPA
jgi:hypothetical protein